MKATRKNLLESLHAAGYQKVVDQCYPCDLCYLTKCPYVPLHEWNVDFPHLVLRATVVNYENGDTRFRDSILASTDLIGKVARAPLINAAYSTRHCARLAGPSN